MDYRYLGKSALKVSPITLGTMMFGGPTDEATSKRIIDKARDQGINFIDTANVYQSGASEEVVGRAIKANRDHWVLASKIVNSREPGPNAGGFSRKSIIAAVEGCLKRLGADYIDIMYFHRAVYDAPVAEAVRAMADLIHAGKLRYFAVSNFRGWRIAEISQAADAMGIDRPIASQPLYNIVNRSAEAEEIPAAGHYGLGVVSYSPLARGVLTGKYQPNMAPDPTSRAGRNDARMMQVEWRPESVELSAKIAAYTASVGTNPIDFAMAWVLNNKLISSVIAGPRTEEQWDSYFPKVPYQITAEDEAFVDSMVAPGHPSTPGFTDPSYPVEGRVPRALAAGPAPASAKAA